MFSTPEASASAPTAINIQQQDEIFMRPTPNHSQPAEQPSAPMRRAPVPNHIREQLNTSSNSTLPRSPACSRSQPPLRYSQAFLYIPNTPKQYLAPQQEIQRYQMMQQRQVSDHMQPSIVDYGPALDSLNRQVQQEYSRPSQAITEYAQRRVHVAEYGRPPPHIPPPPPKSMIESRFLPLGIQHIPRPVSNQPRSRAPYRAPPVKRGPQFQHVKQPLQYQRPRQNVRQNVPRSSQRSDQPWVPKTQQDAESGANWIDNNSGLNAFGAPRGYMPANVVENFKAWDKDGSMRWVQKQ